MCGTIKQLSNDNIRNVRDKHNIHFVIIVFMWKSIVPPKGSQSVLFQDAGNILVSSDLDKNV